ncbi:MAG: VCBS repeat-containing protein [Candidatus Zixiibacteriota bacterium]|nr:MAG: VCBS repeat-containing protein [candidate division Zixibacteria bacterium]
MRRKIIVFCMLFVPLFLVNGFGSDGGTPPSVLFEVSPQTFGPWLVFEVGLADIDGDQDQDVVFPIYDQHVIIVYFNDGSGHLTGSGQSLPYTEGHGIGMADFDFDGDIDFFVTSTSTSHGSAIYLNDGSGHFTKSGQQFGDISKGGGHVQVHDIDSDQDPDIIVEYFSLPDVIYKNDGNGNFQESSVIAAYCTDFADLDADGDLDCIECVSSVGYRTMENDGSGNFTQSSFLEDPSLLAGDVGFGDLDNDGDIDAVVTTGFTLEAAPTRILLNDGTGSFSFSDLVLANTYFGAVCVRDFNADAFPDIVLTSNGMLHQLYVNDGGGGYVASEFGISTEILSTDPSGCDLNGDHLVDLVVNDFDGGATRIWFNRTQIVSCCTGQVGNVDGDPENVVDIGDLTRLIDYLFISFEEPGCMAEANVDGISPVDIGDLTALIDFLFISYDPLAECP